MGQTHIQTRVPDELFERIEEYEESNDYMNQAEAVRALLRAGLDAEESDEPDEFEKAMREAEREESERLLSLARLAEKAAILTVAFSLTSLLFPLLAVAGIERFELTVGTFVSNLIVRVSLVAAVGAMVTFAVSFALVAYLVAAHGIEAGWFGRRVESVIANGEVTA
jgi:Arc/MetJ-type ribon-helix-helix transcriptional regulator